MTVESDIVLDWVVRIRLLQVDGQTLGVREDAVLRVIDWVTPTPLPFSPGTVAGVVSVQGRMFTVIDLRVLLDNEARPGNGKQIVALRGAEQLALAVDDSKGVIEVDRVDGEDSDHGFFRGNVLVNEQSVSLINPDALFAVVIHGRERRRRRL